MQYNNSNSRKSSSNLPKNNSTAVSSTTYSSLPTGWKREEVMKPHGLYAGKSDICYISPTGERIKNKMELKKALGQSYDVSIFDWKYGKFIHSRKRTSPNNDDSQSNKLMKLSDEHHNRLKRSVVLPTFGEYVPVIEKTNEQSTVQSEDTNEIGENLTQLLWHKRLGNINPINSDTNDKMSPLELPQEIQNAGISGLGNTQLVQSIVSCIYNNSKANQPIVGQNIQKSHIEKNPCLSLTSSQPLIKQIYITDEIINRQEAKVNDLRKKLERVRRTLLPKLNVGDAA